MGQPRSTLMHADPKTVHGGLTAAIADESFGGVLLSLPVPAVLL